MVIVLDALSYGTPTVEQLKLINSHSYIDTLFTELTEFTFPKNSSDATKGELNEIVKAVERLHKDAEAQLRFSYYDKNLPKYYHDYLVSLGAQSEKVNSIISGVIADTNSLVAKLKYFFQRPRPHQLAYYYKLKLTPYHSVSADSPSFPSGHAYTARLLSEVLGNAFPELYSQLTELWQDVCVSRIEMGLHYQSDIDVAIYAAERTLRNREFALKNHI